MAKFNSWGQWALEKSDTKVSTGPQISGPKVSTGTDKTEGLKGADLVKMMAQQIATGSLPIAGPKPAPQPTNEQMFGHLVKSEEEIQATEDKWNSGNAAVMRELSKPVDHLVKSQIEGSWGNGKSFNSMLSKEELAKRNREVGEE